MPTSTRLTGRQGYVFTLKKGAAAAASYADDAKSWEVEFEAKDDADLTFYEAQQGTGYNATLTVTTVISWDSGALFNYIWDNVGQDLVVVLGPSGNATPSATKPHFTGTASVKLPPGMSNEARQSTEGAETEIEFVFSTPLSKVTA